MCGDHDAGEIRDGRISSQDLFDTWPAGGVARRPRCYVDNGGLLREAGDHAAGQLGARGGKDFLVSDFVNP